MGLGGRKEVGAEISGVGDSYGAGVSASGSEAGQEKSGSGGRADVVGNEWGFVSAVGGDPAGSKGSGGEPIVWSHGGDA